ncbi:MAG: trimeric intracellular cation channel family protein [Micrococcaceae bacterium]
MGLGTYNSNFSLIADLIGTFFFAVSGSLLAVRMKYDIVGSIMLASITGLGGGVIRDLIIAHGGTPGAFENPIYLTAPLAAALLVYAFYHHVVKRKKTLIIFDAAGLALFSIVGTLKALDNSMNPYTSMLLGVSTAVGGGLLRDVIANKPPALFAPDEVYATPAFLGAGLTVVLYHFQLLNLFTGSVVAILVFATRLYSYFNKLSVPSSYYIFNKNYAKKQKNKNVKAEIEN